MRKASGNYPNVYTLDSHLRQQQIRRGQCWVNSQMRGKAQHLLKWELASQGPMAPIF